MLLVQRFL